MSQPNPKPARKPRSRNCDFDALPPRSTLPPEKSSDPSVHAEIVTVSMHCHHCSHKFSARVDYRIHGNHLLTCPYCGHVHCRVVKNGRVTEDRWDSREETVTVMGCRWTADSHPMTTSTVFEHVRNAWMERLR